METKLKDMDINQIDELEHDFSMLVIDLKCDRSLLKTYKESIKIARKMDNLRWETELKEDILATQNRLLTSQNKINELIQKHI